MLKVLGAMVGILLMVTPVAEGDFPPPPYIIASNVTVCCVTNTNATLQFDLETDEPSCAAQIRYHKLYVDVDQSFPFPEVRGCTHHNVTIGGLEASSTYEYYFVMWVPEGGHGGTQDAGPWQFQTLAEPLDPPENSTESAPAESASSNRSVPAPAVIGIAAGLLWVGFVRRREA